MYVYAPSPGSRRGADPKLSSHTRPTDHLAFALGNVKSTSIPSLYPPHDSRAKQLRSARGAGTYVALHRASRHGYSSSPSLLSLAPESVANNVFKQVNDKKDVSNSRLACSTLEMSAVKELFKEVFVSPLEEHILSWKSIGQDDVTDEDAKQFDAVSRFPASDSLEIGFTPDRKAKVGKPLTTRGSSVPGHQGQSGKRRTRRYASLLLSMCRTVPCPDSPLPTSFTTI
ncbi:hypothetical protein BDU57DRAFT_532444 [Ampelomyces quisqualis]|uniref:Uncharacterized protein n=1 Tax=Ampelomyces quisqualis TaxID=50730 RepID=A0A6A5QH65_AMPQU|nr:hypothetical protein BDU57DRAFT_532444 [Ampelomyces quisqualis]